MSDWREEDAALVGDLKFDVSAGAMPFATRAPDAAEEPNPPPNILVHA